MAVKIQIRRGAGTVPVLAEGELAFSTDMEKVFIGTSNSQNIEILTESSEQVIQDVLDGKAPTVHTHLKVDILDLQDALDLKVNIADFETHTHTKSDITDLQDALDLKFNIADLASALEAKADSDHNHTLDSLANVTITSILQGDVLKWDGNAWTNQTDNFGGEGGSESDPTVAPHIKAIETTDIINWDTAYAYSEVGHLTSVSESDVTQHQGAISITESQISDLQPFLTSSSTLPGSQITSTGVDAGEVLIADGSGGSSFQNPLVYEWEYVSESTDSSSLNSILIDTSDGVTYDWTNYDYKFVYHGATDSKDVSTSSIQLNNNTLQLYSSMYQLVYQSDEGVVTTENFSDSRRGNILTGLGIDDNFSQNGNVTEIQFEFILSRSRIAVEFLNVLRYTWLLRGEGHAHYWPAPPLSSVYQNGMAFSKFTGIFYDSQTANITSVSVNHFLNEGVQDFNRIKVYKREK